MRFSCKSLLLLLIIGVSAHFSPVYAVSMGASLTISPSQVPLVIIRFNQRAVYYERQLFNAIQRAVDAKPSVRFEVVSYVPITGQHSRDSRAMNMASTNQNKVLNSMREIGIPRKRIGVHIEPDSRLKYDEVHVFVQ